MLEFVSLATHKISSKYLLRVSVVVLNSVVKGMSETVVGMAGGIKAAVVAASLSDASPFVGTVKTPTAVSRFAFTKGNKSMMELLSKIGFIVTVLPMIAAYVAGGFGELVKAFTEKMPPPADAVYPFAGDFVAEFGEAVDA